MKNKNIKVLLISMLVFAIFGLFVSIFLAYEYSQPEPIGCPLSSGTGNSCETVRQSNYSEIFGIKLPFYGILFFITTIIGIIINFIKEDKRLRYSLLALILIGFVFETIMTLIQVFVIEAICTWCILTELSVLTIFALSIVYFLETRTK